MKKIVVQTGKCTSCGMCTVDCDLLQETMDGTVEVVSPGIIPEGQLEKIKEIVSLCPSGALFLKDDNFDANKALQELKVKLKEPLKLSPPSKSDYRWEIDEKDEFVKELPVPYVSGEDDYCYKSPSDARSAGKQAFRDEIYSQADALAQQLVVSYWQRKLNAVVRYAEVGGNFKYETHRQLANKLKSYIHEIETCTGKKLSLPSDFLKFYTKDTEYIEHIQEKPNDWLANRIRENLPSASEFYDSIKTDSEERFVTVSHFFGDDTHEVKKRYCYSLTKAIERFNRYLGRTVFKCAKYTSQDGEREFDQFCREITAEWNKKADYLYKQVFKE